MGFFTEKRYNVDVDTSDFPEKSDLSIYLGRVAEDNTQVYMDPDQLTKHVAIAGITGGGKTVAGNVILEGALKQGASAIIIDPTLEWTGIIKPNTDHDQRQLYSKFKMYDSDSQGTMTDIISMKDQRDRALDLKTIMTPGLATVVTANNLPVVEIERYICDLIACIKNQHFPESRKLRLLVIFDEVHIILTNFGGTGTGFVQLEVATREFRTIGVGIALLSQVLEDFIGSIRANINTEVQMRTSFDNDLDKARMKYGEVVADAIMRAQSGTGLFHNADYNIGRPFFLSFRPPYHSIGKLSEQELEDYFAVDALICAEKNPENARMARERLRRGKISGARLMVGKQE